MIEIYCDQKSSEWFKCRLGIPTASQFNRIVTPTGKLVSASVRQNYIDELAAEAISGVPSEHYVSWRMKKAAETEDESRMVYAMDHEAEVRQVGFVYKDERRMFGASPDGLIDPNGGFETKGAQGSVQIKRLRENIMISEHIPQVQGNLYVCEREWWDFQSYSHKIPELCIRNYRDEKYIKVLSEELERFCYDLASVIKKLKELS